MNDIPYSSFDSIPSSLGMTTDISKKNSESEIFTLWAESDKVQALEPQTGSSIITVIIEQPDNGCKDLYRNIEATYSEHGLSLKSVLQQISALGSNLSGVTLGFTEHSSGEFTQLGLVDTILNQEDPIELKPSSCLVDNRLTLRSVTKSIQPSPPARMKTLIRPIPVVASSGPFGTLPVLG